MVKNERGEAGSCAAMRCGRCGERRHLKAKAELRRLRRRAGLQRLRREIRRRGAAPWRGDAGVACVEVLDCERRRDWRAALVHYLDLKCDEFLHVRKGTEERA